MAEQELETLVTYLTGDSTAYQKELDKSWAATKKYLKLVEESGGDGEEAFKKVKRGVREIREETVHAAEAHRHWQISWTQMHAPAMILRNMFGIMEYQTYRVAQLTSHFSGLTEKEVAAAKEAKNLTSILPGIAKGFAVAGGIVALEKGFDLLQTYIEKLQRRTETAHKLVREGFAGMAEGAESLGSALAKLQSKGDMNALEISMERSQSLIRRIQAELAFGPGVAGLDYWGVRAKITAKFLEEEAETAKRAANELKKMAETDQMRSALREMATTKMVANMMGEETALKKETFLLEQDEAARRAWATLPVNLQQRALTVGLNAEQANQLARLIDASEEVERKQVWQKLRGEAYASYGAGRGEMGAKKMQLVTSYLEKHRATVARLKQDIPDFDPMAWAKAANTKEIEQLQKTVDRTNFGRAVEQVRELWKTTASWSQSDSEAARNLMVLDYAMKTMDEDTETWEQALERARKKLAGVMNQMAGIQEQRFFDEQAKKLRDMEEEVGRIGKGSVESGAMQIMQKALREGFDPERARQAADEYRKIARGKVFAQLGEEMRVAGEEYQKSVVQFQKGEVIAEVFGRVQKAAHEAGVSMDDFIKQNPQLVAGFQKLADLKFAQHMREQTERPMEAFTRRMKELNGVFERGAMSRDEYSRAVMKVRKETLGATAATESFQAATSRGAEAKSRIQAYLERIRRTPEELALMAKPGKETGFDRGNNRPGFQRGPTQEERERMQKIKEGMDPEVAKKAVEQRKETNDLLRGIRDAVKGKGAGAALLNLGDANQ